jgi:hypothetical protein
MRKVLVLSCLAAAALAAEAPRGCTGSVSLGTVRIEIRRSEGAAALPVKSVSVIPAGSRLIWDPAHLSPRFSHDGEVTAILAPAQGKITVLPPNKASAHIEWQLPISPSVVALVVGPQGLNMGKVTSLIKRNEDLLAQLADYAEQTSEVEALVQELADSEAGKNTDAALKGFSAQYGVAVPKLDSTTSSSQQAALLLHAMLPSVNNYDPLGTTSTQMQQSAGLAASVAGLFFGNGFGLAAGGTALIADLKTALFPGTELRSAFAQSGAKDSLALCTKTVAPKSHTRFAYLWAYRVPGLKPPVAALAGTVHLPLGSASVITFSGPVKDLDRARDWKLAPLSGAAPVPVTVSAGPSPNTLKIDLTDSIVPAGDYRLTAFWDWDPLSLGKLHLHSLADFQQVRIAPESRRKLIEGSGKVDVQLTGPDFEFVEKAAVQKLSAKPAPLPVEFDLPTGKRGGVQTSMSVEIDTAAHGSYKLLLAQSDGRQHEIPVTILPPNPKISNLPLRVNAGEADEPIKLEGSGLDRIEAVISGAGAIRGKAEAHDWTGDIRPKSDLVPGARYPLILELKGVDEPLSLPDAIEVVGPRPRIAGIHRSMPGNPGIELRDGELPAGTTVGMVLEVKGLHEGARPNLRLDCRPGDTRRTLTLSPDEPSRDAALSFAGPGELYLSLDPGTVGYTGCGLSATLQIQPEGQSDRVPLGRVVRLPKLEQFTLTAEPVGPGIFAGILKGTDLDLVEKAGWDAQNGLPVQAIPAPVPGEPVRQTLRIALPWPSPAPHSPLYIWLRGERDGRRTAVAD